MQTLDSSLALEDATGCQQIISGLGAKKLQMLKQLEQKLQAIMASNQRQFWHYAFALSTWLMLVLLAYRSPVNDVSWLTESWLYLGLFFGLSLVPVLTIWGAYRARIQSPAKLAALKLEVSVDKWKQVNKYEAYVTQANHIEWFVQAKTRSRGRYYLYLVELDLALQNRALIKRIEYAHAMRVRALNTSLGLCVLFLTVIIWV